MSEDNSKIFNFIDRISNFALNFEKIPNFLPEIIALALFPILFYFFGYFHEPWFDEAQAWQIAKTASYHDILFYLPHFEGHPPLWHLILSIFAKNHFPYEITLLSVSFVFSYITAFLIIFKSPFYRIIRVLLPYSYFLFYQNGIIARPYCMIMLAFSLLAIFYEKRHEKPVKYSFALIFLALTHAFSFVISSVLALFWFIEGIKKKHFKTIKFYCACIILGICYILISCIIFPSPDAIACNYKNDSNIFERLLFVFVILPSDCFISDTAGFLQLKYFKFYELIFSSIMGLFAWLYIFLYTKDKFFLFLTFLAGYCAFAIFAVKYFTFQQLGIVFTFFIFIFWLALQSNKERSMDESEQITKIKKTFVLFITICMSVSLYWSFRSCLSDILIRYYPGKQEAQFIKKYNLNKYNILVSWNHSASESFENVNLMGLGVVILPYFDENIFYNFNNKDNNKQYVSHRKMPQDEINKEYSKWAEYALPDVIVGNVNLGAIYKNIEKKYVTVYSDNYSAIRKGLAGKNNVLNILVEKELAKKLNLEEIQPVYHKNRWDLEHLTEKIAIKILLSIDKYRENK